MLKNILHFPKTHIFAAGSLSLALGAVLLLNPSTDVEANRISIPLPLTAEAPLTGADHAPLPQQALAVAISTSNHSAAQTAAEPQALAIDTPSAVTQALAVDEEKEATNSLQDESAAADVTVENSYEEQSHQELDAAEVTEAADAGEWRSFKIASGDSLSTLFQRAGYDAATLHEVLAADKQKTLRKLFPGNTLEFHSKNGELAEVRLKLNRLETIHVSKNDAGNFVAETVAIKPDSHTAFGSGTINSSLYMAGQQAGLSQGLIMEMAKIFGYDVDFAQDLRKGDQFNVVYEELHVDGKKVGYGNILAASFKNQGKTYTAVRYTDSDGRTAYYRPNGNSLKKAFLRTPVDFARISSHFDLSRRHPILHKIRAHNGTDYAASHGTPIRAAGDGKVIFAGVKGGYGNTLIVQHGQSVTTLYAHAQKFAKGVRVGSRVDQGQVIGYVGSSGLATGPHLHYEFRVNGVPKNPVTVKFPEASPISRHELARFKQQTSVHLAQLETFMESNRVAMNER